MSRADELKARYGENETALCALVLHEDLQALTEAILALQEPLPIPTIPHEEVLNFFEKAIHFNPSMKEDAS